MEARAPSLVYQEGNLIQTTLRDNYDKNVELVEVQGEKGYAEATELMKNMMPTHAKKIVLNKNARPLFHQYNLEQDIEATMSPEVSLPSGGYIVINKTEALVAIDVNSGKARKERALWETAFKTNLEAADEVARQLRLRDLSGLIVIDFIDMDKATITHK